MCKSNHECVLIVWLAQSSSPGGGHLGWWPATAAAALGRGKMGWAIGKQQRAGGVQCEILFCKVSVVKKKKKKRSKSGPGFS